jgi:hypothetical protein
MGETIYFEKRKYRTEHYLFKAFSFSGLIDSIILNDSQCCE